MKKTYAHACAVGRKNYLNKYNREQALKMHYKDTFSLYTLRIKFISILIKVFSIVILTSTLFY